MGSFDMGKRCSCAPTPSSKREELEHHLKTSPASMAHHAEFLAYMSHELRTPLNAIIGFTQVMKMQEDYPDLQLKRDEYIDLVDQSAEQLLNVTQIILSYLEQVCEIEAAREA